MRVQMKKVRRLSFEKAVLRYTNLESNTVDEVNT